jgi:hypothetical protein
MSRQAVASLDGLSLSIETGSICERIYLLLMRVYESNDQRVYGNKIIELANELMSMTRTYDVLFLYLNDSLTNLDYGKALKVGRLLLQHEAVLHHIASEGAIGRPSLLN